MKNNNFNTQNKVNGVDTNKNQVKTNKTQNMEMISMKNNNISTQNNVNSFNTTENNNNGDDNMKLLTKKQFKRLRKGQAFSEYESVGNTANNLFGKLKQGEVLFKEAKADAKEANLRADNAEARADNAELRVVKAEAEAKEAKAEAKEAKAEAKEANLRAVKAEAKADAGLEINRQVQEELEKRAESISDDYEVYDDCTDELAIKAEMINNFRNDIKRNNKIIAVAKHDIKIGVAVNRNKKRIRDLEGQNRYLQNQIDCFQATFNDVKTRKTAISTTIDAKRNDYESIKESWEILKGALII